MLKKIVVWGLVATLVVGAVLWLRQRGLRCRPPEIGTLDDPAELDDLHTDLPDLNAAEWVRRFIPRQSAGGYNLVFYRRRLPMIIDMNGRIVHSWPQVRGVGRVRLHSDGSLAVIGDDHLIKEYDWEGRLTWFFQLPDKHSFPHHDLARLRNDNYLILGHDGHSHADTLYEVDREGRIVWEWWFKDHKGSFEKWDPESLDPTHSNSIRELPPNKWFESGDQRFRPGNILVSARNLDTIFIIDKESSEVVWQWSEKLDRQHEAVVMGTGGPRDGQILVFNNGHLSQHSYRKSRAQLIDPVARKVIWEYNSKTFFSSIGGTAQVLADNNVLITSSHGGRVFEVTPEGSIVWEWTPPFKPMRVERLASDHCPQLAALPTVKGGRVKEPDGARWVDEDLYQFGLPEQLEEREISGQMRRVLPENNGCRKLQIPQDATLRVQYGIDRAAGDTAWMEGDFKLTIQAAQDEPKLLVDAVLGSNGGAWARSETIPLDEFALQTVKICLSSRVVGGGRETDTADQLVWANPIIQTRSQSASKEATRHRVTEKERKLREKQLKVLGYAD